MRDGQAAEPVAHRLILPGQDHPRRDDNVLTLEGPTRAELAVEDVRRAIRDGDLLPSQALSLRSLAEERGVRLAMLVMLLERLQREHLLEIRGDVAIVAPLDADALASAFRLGDLAAPTMVVRAFETVTPAQLRAFEAVYSPSDGNTLSLPGSRGFDALGRAPGELITVGSPATESRIIESIYDFSLRYLMLAQRTLSDPNESPWMDFLEGNRSVIKLVRKGKMADAAGFVHGLYEQQKNFSHSSVDLYRGTDDDYPVAEIIPINRHKSGRR